MKQTELARANQTLRKQYRKQRRQLSPGELILAQRRLAKQLGNYSALLLARKIVSYLPFDGEMPPRLLEKALPNAQIYYPRITNFNRREMRFYRARQGTQINSLGIIEPVAVGPPVPITHFDVVLLPLVAFDRSGNRLGMGAGFYDRALTHRQNKTIYPRPHLVGLAHHFQEVKSLTAQSWDVPLDAILTDVELITPA